MNMFVLLESKKGRWFCNKTTKTVNLMFYVRRWSFPLGQLVAVLSLSPHTTGLKYLSVSLLGTLGMANHLAVSIQTHENLISFYFWCLYFLSRFERNCHKDAVLIALSNSVRPFDKLDYIKLQHNTKNESMLLWGEIIKKKHCKSCQCCPGHSLSVSH